MAERNHPWLTHDLGDLTAFVRRLGERELAGRRNYFRWLEYPLALSMAAPKKHERVLEIGAGFINALPLWMAADFCARVTAVDRKPLTDDLRAYVDGLARGLEIPDGRLAVMQADATALPFDDDSFDLVMCVSTLEHAPLPDDSRIAAEIGRVLAPGGRAILSFPFNHDGCHIESEEWHGEEYQQRHYNEYTTRQRVIHPSGLWFIRAAILGEVDPRAGKRYLAWTDDARRAWCEENESNWTDYWRIYHDIERDEFYLNPGEVSDEVAQNAGIVCMELEKRELRPQSRYFFYEPFEADRQNDGARVTIEQHGRGLAIESAVFSNFFAHDVECFESGMNCWVRVTFVCDGEIDEPVFRIAFHAEDGTVVAGFDTHEGGCRFGKLRGRNVIHMKFGMLNLAGGRYEVSVGAWEYPEPNPIPPFAYDVRHKAWVLVVRDRRPGSLGVTYCPCEVSVEPVADEENSE
ncbi:MAG: methyltransferase domain-containing protein [Deltaproteobacteria bacterium]|nr:methyltransferase domain-containing protein [Deltaproteobacteria bacterium]